jgi:glycosyltransferase involved in cell wall biosynthesis
MNVASVSVLICTYNRAALLRETLAALHAMDTPDACSVEIIVVDNNSTDDTTAVVADSIERARYPMILIQERQQGKSFALNAGLAAASGEVVALTDDDVLPATDWVVRIVQAFRTQAVTFVFGKVLPRWQSAPPPELLTPPAQAIWGPLAIVDYGDEPSEYTTTSPGQRLPIGANLAVLRSVLVSIGGWRTDLGKVNNTLICGEDHEIFMRFRRCGFYSGYYDPRIVVRHLVPTKRLTRRYFRQWFFWHGKTTALMLDDLYPEIDMPTVPRVGGAPRFLYRQALRQCVRWAATRRADPLTALIEELKICQFFGLFVECWRRRKQIVRRLATSLVVTASMAGVGATVVEGTPSGLRLTFRDGHISVVAHGVTVQQVLKEWERVGHTQVVHAEAAAAALIDIDLQDVTEEEALDVLLRSSAGFLAIAAQAPGETTSHFERILIVPSTSSPRELVQAAAQSPASYLPPVQPTTVQRLIYADGTPVPDDQDGAPLPRKAAE